MRAPEAPNFSGLNCWEMQDIRPVLRTTISLFSISCTVYLCSTAAPLKGGFSFFDLQPPGLVSGTPPNNGRSTSASTRSCPSLFVRLSPSLPSKTLRRHPRSYRALTNQTTGCKDTFGATGTPNRLCFTIATQMHVNYIPLGSKIYS